MKTKMENQMRQWSNEQNGKAFWAVKVVVTIWAPYMEVYPKFDATNDAIGKINGLWRALLVAVRGCF